MTLGAPEVYTGCRICPLWTPEFGIWKQNGGEFGIEIIQGIMRDTGLRENNWGRDDGIEEPYWKPL